MELSSTRGMIVDMDGVLWRGSDYLPGYEAFFAALRRLGIGFVLATNNATRTPEEVLEKVRAGGVEIALSEVLTSAQAAAAYLQERFPPGSGVYAIGENGLLTAIREAGFKILSESDGARAVVVGLDREVNWMKLTEAGLAVANGAAFIGTNPDPSLPVERGEAVGNGALLAAITTTTGVSPTVVGKPEPYLFTLALSRLGTPAERTLVLGDRLDTDILGGRRAGLPTALVLTGATRRAELEGAQAPPDFVFDDLPQVIEALGKPPA